MITLRPRCFLAYTVALMVLATPMSAGAQRTPVAELGLDRDMDADGIADGWLANTDAGTAAFDMVGGWDASKAQQVTAGAPHDGVFKRLDGLDKDATYLLTAWIRTDRGGMIWGPEGINNKYLHGYGKWIESRQTFSGTDAATLIFYAQTPDAVFSIDNVRLDRIQHAPLAFEQDTGQTLIPRPRRMVYEPHESEGFILTKATPFLCPDGWRVDEWFRADLGLVAAAGDMALTEACTPGQSAVAIGSQEALNANRARLSPAMRHMLLLHTQRLAENGYWLAVTGEGIVIAATNPGSARHALATLRQLCIPTGEGAYRIPRLFIYDWPELPFRAAYCGGATLSDSMLSTARDCARLKMNALVMESDIYYHLNEGNNLAKVRECFETLRGRFGLEPIPLVQSFGWGHYVLAVDPGCVESVYVPERKMVFARSDDLPVGSRSLLPDGAAEYLVSSRQWGTPRKPFANPSFEQREGNKPGGWQVDPGDDENRVFVDEGTSTDGAASLAMVRGTPSVIRAWQDQELPSDDCLRIAVDMKAEGITGYGAYMEAYKISEDGGLLGAPVARTGVLRGDCDWRRMSLSLDTREHRRYRIYVRIQDGAGKAWFDNLKVSVGNLLLRNLVRVDDTLQLRSPDGQTYVRGDDYSIIPGETKYPFTDEARPWWVKRLPGGSIPEGGQVLVSYEHAPVGAITYCPSNPRTHEIMQQTLSTVVRELKPAYVHIGHDEPRWMNRCKRCLDRQMSNASLFAEELCRMRRFVKQADPSVDVIMWADALNPYHNAPSQNLEPANDLIPKDIIQCPWYYAAQGDVIEGRAMAFFADKGFRTLGAPWYNLENNWDWSQECAYSRRMTGKCMGVIYTSWGGPPQPIPWQGLPFTAGFAWNPDDPPAMEMLPSYQGDPTT